MIRPLTDQVAVAPQLSPEALPALAAAGYAVLVNNRPDDEEPGQPSGTAMQAAAEAAGMRYLAIPVTHSGFGHHQLEAMAAALAGARGEGGGKLLAFCRSGTRSCNLWALAEAKAGGDPAALVAAAREAGYDLSAIRPTLDALSAGR